MAPTNAPFRDWLASLAVKELESALDIFEGYVPGLYRESPNGILSCAPNSITVHQKKKKALQIVEFLDSECSSSSSDRIVLVSDGTSLIKAIFEEDGIAAYEQSSGRKVDELKGATITSTKIDLVFHKDADPSDALKLHVVVFNSYGGEGARTFGSPTYFSKEPNLKQIFKKLNRLLSGPLASSVPSLPSNSDPKDTPSHMLHTQFATQIVATQPAEMGAQSEEDSSDQEAVIVTSKRLQEATNTLFHDAFQTSNPFENIKRVPRKFARIPREQQLLLENEDSWYNPSVQVANLPDSIRQGLATFLEQETYTSESSQDSDEDDEETPERVELDSSERKILKTINQYSSPIKSRPASHKNKCSMQEQAPDNATPRVAQHPVMTLAVPVETGEFADDEDEDMPLPSLPAIPPSTARNKSPIVQVKRTPRTASNSRSSPGRLPQEDHEDSSSNLVCIPATHVDLSSQLWQSSVDTRQAGKGPEQTQPIIDSSLNEIRSTGSNAQSTRHLGSTQALLASTNPASSLPPSKEKAPAVNDSLQKRKIEGVAIVQMNSPSPFSKGVANSPVVSSRPQGKSRKSKRKSRGRTAEDEFFANREVEDPEEAVKKMKQEFLETFRSKGEAPEGLPYQQSSGIPSSISNKIRVPTIGVPTTDLQKTQRKLSMHNHTTTIPSMSNESEHSQMIDQENIEPIVKSFMDGDSTEAKPILENQDFLSGSSTGPDEDFQSDSSPPHLPSPRQVLVDSQELVLSIESEAIDLELAQDDGFKDKVDAENINMLRREEILFKDDENHFEDLDDDDLEQVVSREATDLRQRSSTSEEDGQPDLFSVTEDHLFQPLLEDDSDEEDLSQQDSFDHEEFRQPEVDSDFEEEPRPEDSDQGSLRQQEAKHEIKEEIIQEAVTEERFSQAEFSPEDSPGSASFFDIYKSQYPSYTGTPEDFTTALVYLEWLLANRKLLHPTFYDDFVNFYPEEYLALGGDKLGTKGYDMFHEKVDEPTFKAKVIFRHSLQEAIRSMDEAIVQKNRARFETPEKAILHRSRSASRALISSTPAQPAVPPRTLKPVVSHLEIPPQKELQEEMDGELVEKLDLEVKKAKVQPDKPSPERIEEHLEKELEEGSEIEEDIPSFETRPKPKSVHRERFFDTPSQAMSTKRKEAPMDLEPSYSSAKKHRTLPWQNKPDTSKPKQPQFQGPRGTPRLASPELGEEIVLSKSHRPSTRHTDRTKPISPPPLKDPNRRKTIGTDKVIQTRPKPQSRNSMAATTKLDVGPKNPSAWERFLWKNKGNILRQSRSPSVVSSTHSSSSKRKTSRMEDH